MRQFLVAAPHSGSGKTLVTLGLLRAFRNAGVHVQSAKAGPDYIDPAFHSAASGKPCVNLDPWAMRKERLHDIYNTFIADSELAIVEGMMGLYDGAADGSGSAADLAVTLNLPVVLVVDASKMSYSIAAIVRGFRDHRRELQIAGVILNRVGSSRHEQMLRTALDDLGVAVLGAVPKLGDLSVPSRHLGLVQASEHEDLECFIAKSADTIEKFCDLETLGTLGGDLNEAPGKVDGFPPLGQRIAVAEDVAFSFAYPHVLADWQKAGAEVSTFSPLRDEGPNADSDAVFLPGGYPELHAHKIAGATSFFHGLVSAQEKNALIYGECGGYMVLGEGLVDADGVRHKMAGLLQLDTSFAERKLHLGYRRVRSEHFPVGNQFSAHEFHYTSVLKEVGDPLFEVWDGVGSTLGVKGLRKGNVMGSYLHIIDRIS
ncbi:MAG: cobyrinate a,c-diamide synthase [Pseudomonadota bacterium]